MAKYTKKTDVDETVEAVNEAVETEESKTENKETKKVTKAKKKFDQSDEIMCRSVVQGGLYLEGSRSGILYTWEDYGAECCVEYRDLVAAVRSRSKYVFSPFFIIEDEDFVAEFPQVEKYYSENYSLKELGAILEHPVDKMLAELKILPKGAYDTIKDMAAVQISTGQLDSVRKIKALDEFFGTDLNLISEVFHQ